MARVTVEDCIDKVSNRFELACHRARSIAAQSPITVDRQNDKNSVIALREIAETTISTDDVKEAFIQSMQQYVEVDEPESESNPLLDSSAEKILLERDDKSQDTVIDRLTEIELLRGIKNIPAPENNWQGTHRYTKHS